jgi:hypothetical protein
MKSDGLYTLNGQRADKDWNDDNNNNSKTDTTQGYRYEDTQKTIDSLKTMQEKQIQKIKDSLKKQKDQIDKKLENLEDRKVTKEAVYQWQGDRTDFIVNI